METHNQLRRAVESEIRTAFRGVTLGQGVSLRHAESLDAWSPDSRAPAQGGITDDWSAVPMDELERDCIVFLDALGFRYYIPALMLSLLNNYDSSSMRVIGTLRCLYLKKDHRQHAMHHNSLLNLQQRTAVARFLAALPKLVELDSEDQKIVPRALDKYWGEYLQISAAE